MYQSFIPARVPTYLWRLYFWLILYSLQSMSAWLKMEGDNLLSENCEVFYFRNDDVMYYLRWQRSSVRRDF